MITRQKQRRSARAHCRRSYWLTLAAAAALLVTACQGGVAQSTGPSTPAQDSASQGEADQEPIRIGLVFGLTGSAAFNSNQAVQGAELAISQINADGGVLGRQLEASVQDGQCEPVEGANAIRRLMEAEDIKLVIGPTCSSAAAAMLPIAEELEGVLIVSVASAPNITEEAGVGGNPWVFRTNPHDAVYAPALARAITEEGDQAVAIVAANDDFGRGAAEAFSQELEELGATVVSEDFFDRESVFDFNTVLTRIRGSEADAIIFTGTSEPGIPFIRQFNELQMTQNLYTRALSIDESLLNDLGELADGLYSTEPYYLEIESPENEQFIADFRDMHGADPGYPAYNTYESVRVLAEAISSAGTDEPSAVRDALESISFDAITGTIDYDDHHQAYLPVFLARVACDPECEVTVVRSVETQPDR